MRHALTFGAGLCLVAALAAPGLRPDVSASEKAPAVASLTLDNVHLRAADPVAAAKWYVDHLAARPGVGPTQVVFGDFVIAFVKTDRPQPSLGSVIDHIAVSVTDVNARAAAMMSAGATRQAATRDLPGFDERIVLVDPFGVSIELLKDGRPGFHHVHLRVPQPTKALDWFSSMLGGSRATLRKRTDGVRFGQFWLLADASGSETP
ncbi:MAG: VOC family protein, partial [Vicinamibacterales bacterium]